MMPDARAHQASSAGKPIPTPRLFEMRGRFGVEAKVRPMESDGGKVAADGGKGQHHLHRRSLPMTAGSEAGSVAAGSVANGPPAEPFGAAAEQLQPRPSRVPRRGSTESLDSLDSLDVFGATGGSPRQHSAGGSRGIRVRNLVEVETVELLVQEEKRDAARKEAGSLHTEGVSVTLRPQEKRWLQVLAEGWASPLRGFMRHAEFLGSLHFSATRGSQPGSVESQPLPIVLPCTGQVSYGLQLQSLWTIPTASVS